jgi:hypothetical protein
MPKDGFVYPEAGVRPLFLNVEADRSGVRPVSPNSLDPGCHLDFIET